jgi:hypothetical protein
MIIKFTNNFYFKALQNLPKLGFFGMKTYHLATLHYTAARMTGVCDNSFSASKVKKGTEKKEEKDKGSGQAGGQEQKDRRTESGKERTTWKQKKPEIFFGQDENSFRPTFPAHNVMETTNFIFHEAKKSEEEKKTEPVIFWQSFFCANLL